MPHRAGQGHHEDYSGSFQVLASAEKAQRGPEASRSLLLAGNSTSWSEKMAGADRVTEPGTKAECKLVLLASVLLR